MKVEASSDVKFRPITVNLKLDAPAEVDLFTRALEHFRQAARFVAVPFLLRADRRSREGRMMLKRSLALAFMAAAAAFAQAVGFKASMAKASPLLSKGVYSANVGRAVAQAKRDKRKRKGIAQHKRNMKRSRPRYRRSNRAGR